MDDCDFNLGIEAFSSMDDQPFGMSLDRFIDGFGIILIVLGETWIGIRFGFDIAERNGMMTIVL